MIKFLHFFAVFVSLLSLSQAQSSCTNVGASQVFLDPTCAQGGVGCNAGGQGQNCRFCGFDIFPPCPSTATTQPTTKPTTTTRTTTTRTTTTTTKPTTTTSTRASTTVRPTVSNDDQSETLDPEQTHGPDHTEIPVVPFTTAPITDGGNGGTVCCKKKQQKQEEIWEGDEKVIFFDDFDRLDLKKWKHDLTMSGGGNWEFQLYHNNRTNSFVKDGVLHIKPTLTEERIGEANLKSNYRLDMWGGGPADRCTGNNFYGCERMSGAGGNILNPIQSAKITTSETFAFKYGRVEVKARLPRGDWLWPAIWLLPAKNIYGMWPASGEIDIMESRGNANYPHSAEGGIDSFGSTLHWGVDWTQNRYPKTHAVYHHPTPLSDDFHVYGLHWTEDRLYTYIDDPDNVVLDVDLTAQSFWELGEFSSNYENPWEGAEQHAPFNNEFYLIINLAVGGTAGYFKDGVGGKPWTDKSSNAVNEFYAAKNSWWPTWQNEHLDFEIDYVKVWSFK